MDMFTRKANEFITEFIKANYEKISVESGECMYNYMCHANSVHRAIRKKQKRIALCFIIDEGNPIVHFINYHKKTYTDNTLGVFSENVEYYFVRFISEEEFKDVFNIHKRLKKQIKRQLPFLIRIISKFEA
jgi:hypothetical protein